MEKILWQITSKYILTYNCHCQFTTCDKMVCDSLTIIQWSQMKYLKRAWRRFWKTLLYRLSSILVNKDNLMTWPFRSNDIIIIMHHHHYQQQQKQQDHTTFFFLIVKYALTIFMISMVTCTDQSFINKTESKDRTPGVDLRSSNFCNRALLTHLHNQVQSQEGKGRISSSSLLCQYLQLCQMGDDSSSVCIQI